MTEAALFPILAEITVNAPIEQVWKVLIAAEMAPQWQGAA